MIEGIDTKTGEQLSTDAIFNDKKMVIIVYLNGYQDRIYVNGQILE